MHIRETPVGLPCHNKTGKSLLKYIIILLRPLTRGRCFLLFLPNSHPAYDNSFVSAFGQSLPPLTGSFKDLLHLDKFLEETEGG